MNQRTKSDFESRQREWEEHRRSEEERQRHQEEEIAVKFRQQEEELRRRQEENSQFMAERGNDLLKNENSQDSFGSGSYQDGSNWRRTSESYGSQGGSSWRGGGSDSWGRSAGADRSSYQRGSSDSDLQPPPDANTFMENFNRGRSFEQGGNDYAG